MIFITLFFKVLFMMEKAQKHLDDLSEIRQIMERSTRFLSLSGLSGVFAGLFALAGTLAAWLYMHTNGLYYDENFRMIRGEAMLSPRMFLLLDASVVLVMALASTLFFSYRKARRQSLPFWSPVLKRLLFHLLVPLLTGGILSVILIWQNHLNLVAPLTLVFYGLALVSAGKFTNREIMVLGAAEILAGLAAAVWQAYGLWFWGAGFGLFHILYGVALYLKYDRKPVRHA